jgi:hypothetical protein
MKIKSTGSELTSIEEEDDEDRINELGVLDKEGTGWTQDDKSVITIDINKMFFFI